MGFAVARKEIRDFIHNLHRMQPDLDIIRHDAEYEVRACIHAGTHSPGEINAMYEEIDIVLAELSRHH